MFVNRTTEKGQAIVLIAFAIFALFALVALAMDGGQAFADRRHAQSAVDAAAYAAALAYHEDDPDLLHPLKMALQRLGSNGYPYISPGSVITNGISYSDENNTMSVVRTTLDSDCAGGYGVKYVVSLTTTVHTWFAPIVGITELHNTVSSTSLACKSTADTNTLETQKTSIMSCSTDTCSGASDTNIFKNGSSTLNLYGGGLYNNSTDPNCLKITNGVLNIYPPSCANIWSVSDTGTVNSITYVSPCSSANSVVLYKQAPLKCPIGPVDTMSAECDKLDQYPPVKVGDPVLVNDDTASPGRYGDFPPNKVTKLNPGLYCIKKSFNIQKGLTGDGVTFYLEPGVNAQWTGNDSVHLYASKNGTPPAGSPKDSNGAYYGLLMFSPASDTKQTLDMAGGPATYLQGTILASSALCSIAGNPGVEAQCVQFICDTWKNTGDNNLSIKYDLSCLYNPDVVDTVMLDK